MPTIDFVRAATFIAAIPEGRWTAYTDVAEAGGNARGAQAVGNWLSRKGDEVRHVHRVLTVEGLVSAGFRPAGPSVPKDAASVRDKLRNEGVVIDGGGRAEPTQRFTAREWLEPLASQGRGS